MRAALWVGAFGLLLAAGSAAAEQTELGKSLKDIPVADHWIYDNLPQGIAEAKKSGKPLLVVTRCVPCPPGKTLDEQVMQPDPDLEKLEKQFVCVRVIQTNGLDLNVFQYDYDQSWAAMFLNADLAIYGRYGTRNSSGHASDGLLSKAGFRVAAEKALQLHKAYPGNKAQLAAKTGRPGEYRHPEETPGLTDRPVPATMRQNCIHCHMVKEYAVRARWEAGKLTADDVWVYPMPERIGLTMDIDNGVLVKSVAEGSPAAKADLAVGDELLTLGGQPLVSTADIQWVLHHTPSESTLPITVRRQGKTLEKTVSLSGDWKRADIAWRASSWYGLRNGVKFDPLPPADKQSRAIPDDGLALLVKGLFGKGGPKVQAAGLKANDVVVAIDGKSTAMSESDFLADLRLNHGPQDAVTLTVLRGSERKDLRIPLW